MSTPKGQTPAEYDKRLAEVRDEVESYDHHWAAQNTLEWLLADRDGLAAALSRAAGEVGDLSESLATALATVELERREGIDLRAEVARLTDVLSRVTGEVEALRMRATACRADAKTISDIPSPIDVARCVGKAQAYAHAAEIIGDAL